MSDTRVSRRHVIKGAGIAGAAGLAVLAPRVTSASADSGDDALVGAWRGTVSNKGGPTFGALTSFASGGTLTTSASIDLQSGQLSTPGYGAWKRTDSNEYVATFWFFTFDQQTNPSGTGRVTGELTVDGDKAHGPFTVTIFDLNDNVVFTTTGTVEFKRIKAH